MNSLDPGNIFIKVAELETSSDHVKMGFNKQVYIDVIKY